MAKAAKDKKPRPDKYAEKVAINQSPDEVLKLFADQANKVVEKKRNDSKNTTR
jgi:hypothetical protein